MDSNVRIVVLATANDKETLEYLSKQEGGLSASAMVRRLIRQEAQRRGIPNFPTISKTTPENVARYD